MLGRDEEDKGIEGNESLIGSVSKRILKLLQKERFYPRSLYFRER